MTRIQVTDDILKQATSCDRFYQSIGIREMIACKEILSVQQIWMNDRDCDDLYLYILNNIKKARRPTYDFMIEWACYSPFPASSVPRGEVWIWSKDEYQPATNRYIKHQKGERHE